ncbi:glycosyltransferase [bacterium]|nr:glycosyltransferase [bacterium]
MRPKIFFFIPVFNEQETVGILLYRISELMRALRFEYRVFLTLDGCTDESPAVVAQYLASAQLSVIDHGRRQGYGPSLLEAIRLALRESESPKRDFFLILDGDFPVDLACLEEMAQQIDRNVDLYSADSFTDSRRMPRSRRLAQWLVRRILRFKGLEPAQGAADLLTTFRGCRLHLLSRAERELARLGRMGTAAPQAASLLFFLSLLPFSRKVMEIRVKHRRISRRKSRFSPFGLACSLLFSKALSGSLPAQQPRPAAEGRPAPQETEDRPEKAATQQARGAQAEEKSEGRSSRRRRRRKSSGEARAVQAADGQTEQKPREKKEPQPQRSEKKKTETAPAAQAQVHDETGEPRPKSRRRRRHRRPANKDGQGSSNTGESAS